jgi:hypothetical protein
MNANAGWEIVSRNWRGEPMMLYASTVPLLLNRFEVIRTRDNLLHNLMLDILIRRTKSRIGRRI